MSKISISIIGATGYTGLELIRLLAGHPNVEFKYLISKNNSGETINNVYPHLEGVCNIELTNTDPAIVANESDLVFLALPNLQSQKIIPELIGKTKIIDLSGDFRIKDISLFKKYYGNCHQSQNLIGKFAYGLPEYQKKFIEKSDNIANPGCFAIAAQLVLLPITNFIKHVDILAVTGSSGSGKTAKENTHHPIRGHNMKSYKIGSHQHIPEIIQSLKLSESNINFVPTSGPFTRGIHLTAFIDLKKKINQSDLDNLFKKAYQDFPFIRMKSEVELVSVIGSNFCDISIQIINQKVVIQAVIDNLIKGAAGNAIQNMNLMFGLSQSTGLNLFSPIYP